MIEVGSTVEAEKSITLSFSLLVDKRSVDQGDRGKVKKVSPNGGYVLSVEWAKYPGKVYDGILASSVREVKEASAVPMKDLVDSLTYCNADASLA